VKAEDRTRQTYRFERWRAVSAGILETAGSTFLLLMAVRWFHAGAIAKAIVAAAGSVGLLFSPVVVSCVMKAGWRTSKAAAAILAVGAASFTVAACWPILPVFVLCSVIAMATSAGVIPLLTQMYQENYPERQRGRLFSRTVMIRIASAAIFSKLAGDALTAQPTAFRSLLFVFAGALGFASLCLSRCPSHPLTRDGHNDPLRGLRYVQGDALFRRTLLCWMLMGLANLMMIPLRVEYLANPKYGQALTAAGIALLTAVIPNLARLVLSPVWGYLFDHMNFFALRVALNTGFAIGILSFFFSNSWAGFIASAIVFGISGAGGDVAWSLWVTKFAPPNRVADYMSVHTFLTGVRGVAAPLIAFGMANHVPMQTLALISTGLIVAASLLLVPEIQFGKRARPASALVEEISE
jgi:MFS family permease